MPLFTQRLGKHRATATLGVVALVLSFYVTSVGCTAPKSVASEERVAGREGDSNLTRSQSALIDARRLLRKAETAAAVERLEQSLALDPDNIESLYELAWLQATSSDPHIFDAESALARAERLVDITQYKQRALRNPNITKAFRIQAIYVLTVAYAANGNYLQAIAHTDLVNQTAERMHEREGSAVSRSLVQAGRRLDEALHAHDPVAAASAETETTAASEAEAALTDPSLALTFGDPFVAGDSLPKLDVPAFHKNS